MLADINITPSQLHVQTIADAYLPRLFERPFNRKGAMTLRIREEILLKNNHYCRVCTILEVPHILSLLEKGPYEQKRFTPGSFRPDIYRC